MHHSPPLLTLAPHSFHPNRSNRRAGVAYRGHGIESNPTSSRLRTSTSEAAPHQVHPNPTTDDTTTQRHPPRPQPKMAADRDTGVVNGRSSSSGSSPPNGDRPPAAATSIEVNTTHVLEWVVSYEVPGRAGPGPLGGLRRQRKTLLQGLGACWRVCVFVCSWVGTLVWYIGSIENPNDSAYDGYPP